MVGSPFPPSEYERLGRGGWEPLAARSLLAEEMKDLEELPVLGVGAVCY